MTGEPLGAMLVRLREDKGYLQHQVAEQLCKLAETPTVTRHEVSRWERELRSPSDFWLGWLSKVFEVPVTELKDARERSRKGAGDTMTGQARTARDGTAAGERKRARPREESSLALVALKYEHRATSVQLNGTYEEPEQATAAIGMFREMVTPESAAPVNGASGRALSAGRNATPAGSDGPPIPAPAGTAVRNGGPARVPMGIRYTNGPGVAAGGSDRTSGSNRNSTNDGTWRKR